MQIAKGDTKAPFGGHVAWKDAAPGFQDFCVYIPHNQCAYLFAPIFAIGILDRVQWVFDWISISRDIEQQHELGPISKRIPNQATLRAAGMVPTGDAMRWLIKFHTKTTNMFLEWAKQNDNKSFQATFGLSFAETLKGAGLDGELVLLDGELVLLDGELVRTGQAINH